MIVKKEHVRDKKTRSGDTEPIYEYKLNMDYWRSIKEPINVVIDEAHSIINARRAMSKVNVIVTDWMALIRRILGSNESGHGELVLITQLPRRLDPIARDMAVQIKYVICHYLKTCKKCGTCWQETSETPEKSWSCLRCASHHIIKNNHVIECFKFRDIDHFTAWKEQKVKSYYDHYFMPNIETVFTMYNTLQWDNLFSNLY